MNRVRHRLVGQHDDHPLDQAPAGEMDDVAVVSASIGANGRLRAGIFAEPSDEVGRVGERGAVRNVQMITQMKLPSSLSILLGYQQWIAKCRIPILNATFTIPECFGKRAALELKAAPCH